MASDLEFIQDQDEWPWWPVLPVVKRQPEVLTCGLVYADGRPTVVVGANIYGLGEIEGKTWGDKLKSFERVDYADFEALLRDWRID